MGKYLDDRELVVCLSKLESVSLADTEDRIISKHFRNLEDKTFYTERGIVKAKEGEYVISIFYQLAEEEFANFKNQKFDDDKPYILPTKKYENTYAVLIFKNTEGYPPHRQIIFDTKKEAIDWIRHNLQYLPLCSLNGNPKGFYSDEEYEEFIFQYGMEEFFLENY